MKNKEEIYKEVESKHFNFEESIYKAIELTEEKVIEKVKSKVTYADLAECDEPTEVKDVILKEIDKP